MQQRGARIVRYVQLRAFHYVAVHNGFSRAAEALHLTQPAISDQIRKLEEEYDITLFNRHKKRVELTEIGQRLLEITHRLFENESQALELLTESRALRSGTLRIIADSVYHVTPILTKFRKDFPGIHIVISTGNSADVIAKLHAYQADIGVLGEVPNGRDFKVVHLNSTPLIAFVAKKHPLAKRKSISLSALSKEALAVRERGSNTRRKLEDAFNERGLLFEPIIEAEGREAISEIVSAGTTVGIVSKAEFNAQANLIAIQLSDAELLMDEALICLKERLGGKLVTAFLKTAGDL